MAKHALLSASSSHRWMNCPPSARLGENYEDRGSDFAAEGTDAHSLCEHKLKMALDIPSDDPTENLSWYNTEMEECACGYAGYVMELVAEARQLVREVRKMGGIAPKFVSPGFDGMPDRIVLLPHGVIAFVELKAPGKKPRPLQLSRHEMLRRLGFRVYVADSTEQIGVILDEIRTP